MPNKMLQENLYMHMARPQSTCKKKWLNVNDTLSSG